jgi:hypothetical protein
MSIELGALLLMIGTVARRVGCVQGADFMCEIAALFDTHGARR